MIAIVNVNENWGIGKSGELLVNIPEDMRFFRETTLGKTVIMGRKTLESFPGGRPLKNRVNIVLTRDASRIKVREEDGKEEPDRRLLIAGSPEELGRLVAGCAPEDVFVIGGETIYRQLLPYCSTCLVTFNDCSREADAWFPDLTKIPGWHCTRQGEWKEHEGVRYRFTVFENREPLPLPGDETV